MGLTGVWSGSVATTDGVFYDYTVVNAKGTRTCLDPYARSMAAYNDDDVSAGNPGRGAIVDLNSAAAQASFKMTVLACRRVL